MDLAKSRGLEAECKKASRLPDGARLQYQLTSQNHMLEPSFFDHDRLWGIFHPATDATSDKLLVVCPPFFDEYRRCYRALAELAKGCASQGAHVFRFDYSGTGESWGELDDATVRSWVGDVRAAIEEGMALSGASRVYLCGVRFGGTLAAQVQHAAIVEYVFWDLVPNGASYLAHLKSVDAQLAASQLAVARRLGISPEPVSYQQFCLSTALREEMDRLTVDLPALQARARVHQIVSRPSEASRNVEYSGFPYDWPTFHDGLLLPKPALEAIARRIA